MMQKQIDGLTGLRGYAALWVMFYHAWTLLIPLTGIHAPIKLLNSQIGFNIAPLFKGWAGVQVFFVLTGFLLFLPFAEKLITPETKISLPHYFKRRCLRIFPAYYLQMAILAILAWWGIYENPPIINWLAHIFMLHNWDIEWNGAINGVWWTLPVELNFYLALPLLFLVVRKIGIIYFTIAAIAVSIAYKMMIFPSISLKETAYKVWLFGQLNARIDLFAYGMLAAYIYKKQQQALSNQLVANGFMIMGMVGIWSTLIYTSNVGGGKIWHGNDFLYFIDSSLGFFIFLLVLGICFNQTFTRQLFCNKIALYFGNISYSIYLWHVPLLVLIFLNPAIKPHVTGVANYSSMAIALLTYICATLAIATASFYLVEKPFLRKQ